MNTLIHQFVYFIPAFAGGLLLGGLGYTVHKLFTEVRDMRAEFEVLRKVLIQDLKVRNSDYSEESKSLASRNLQAVLRGPSK